MNAALSPPSVGVVIRFKNSAATLPAVLEALRSQTVQPDLVLGVDSGSTDGARRLLSAAGARIVDWKAPYHHSRVLNFAVGECPTQTVLALSSHTVLASTDALEKLRAAMTDPKAACASGKWDQDPFYSDAVDWAELRAKGLKFGSIYTNSMGMFRRALWETCPFDESLPTMEDAAWAVEQVKRGYVCRRLSFDFHYQRSTTDRAFVFSALTFQLADRHALKVTWLGPVGSLKMLGRGLAGWMFSRNRTAAREQTRLHFQRLRAWLVGRRQTITVE